MSQSASRLADCDISELVSELVLCTAPVAVRAGTYGDKVLIPYHRLVPENSN